MAKFLICSSKQRSDEVSPVRKPVFSNGVNAGPATMAKIVLQIAIQGYNEKGSQR